MFKNEKIDRKHSFNLFLVLTGTAYGVLFYFLGNFFTGVIYYFTSLSEETLPWLTRGVYFFSALTGAAVAAGRAGGKGLYYGLAVGCLFFFLVWGLGVTIWPVASWSGPLLSKLWLALAAGAVGGVLGVAAAP